MYKYLSHVFNMKHQSQAFRLQKQTLTDKHIILQTDFAENYAVKHQKEVMAAHWMPSTGETVTIYTAIAHYIKDEQLHRKSFAIISNT